MKILSKLTLFVFLLSACGPLTPSTPESALTPGTYEYQDFAYDMVWSDDDSMVALTTLTGLYVYDTRTYKQLFVYKEGSGSTAAFGEKYFAAVNSDGLHVWDLGEFKLLLKKQAQINSFTISSDEKMLATGGEKQISFWSLPDGKLINSVPSEDYTSDMKFINNGHLIVANSYFGNIKELDVESLKFVRTFEFGKPVVTLRLSQNGKLVLVDYGLTGFELWNVDTGKIQHKYGDIVSVSGWQRLSSNNQYVTVWGYALKTNVSGLSVWDLSAHTQLFEFATPIVNGDGWRCGALNSDGSVLAASNNEGYIYFYDMTNGEKTGEIFLPYKFIVEKG